MGGRKKGAAVVLATALAAVVLVGFTTTSNGKSGTSSRGGTMILLAHAGFSGGADPQINYTLQEWQLLIVTHDGLTAFKRVGGKGGTKLVPDLAVSVPKPTNGGKTYTF